MITGAVVNTVTVLAGGSIGMLLKKGIPQKISDTLMKGLGLCTIFIGMAGAMKGTNTLITIISMVLGILIGEALDLDARLNRFGSRLEKRFSKPGEKVSIAEGFVTSCLVFCVGAMTIVGSLQEGLTGDNQMILTKSCMDFVSSMIFASSLGIGVLLSAAFVLVFQGSITLLAQFIAPYLSDYAIAEMTCVGCLLLIGLGLNLLGVTKLKIMNFLPAIIFPVFLCLWL